MERRVIWTDPDGGQTRTGRIVDFDPESDEHDVIFDDGGEAGVFEHEIDFI